MEELISAFEVACALGYSTQTIIRRAREGKIPGAVFLGQSVRFRPSVVEAFIQAGGEQRVQLRYILRHHGARTHSGGRSRNAGRMRDVTVDAEYTVRKDRPEEAREPGQGTTREPGQGAIGYEPRFLGAGRNVTDDYPWERGALPEGSVNPKKT